MNEDLARALAASIAAAFRLHVVDGAIPRIRRCVDQLETEQIWRRHGARGNSIGNLLLHLEGNVRQWILCGVGGADDRRERDAEFAADGSRSTPLEMFERLRATAVEAAAVIDRTTPEELVAERVFQGRYERDVAGAVLHVLEHFSGHAYQIYAWTKQMKGVDLGFWDL